MSQQRPAPRPAPPKWRGRRCTPPGRLGAAVWLCRVPGEDELPVWLEAGGRVQPDRGLIVGAGPYVAERHATLAKKTHGPFHQHLADSPVRVLGFHVHLGPLALEASPRVEENDPAETNDVGGIIGVAVSNRVDDVFAGEAR